jgi:Protein of unknown function (DUF1549)
MKIHSFMPTMLICRSRPIGLVLLVGACCLPSPGTRADEPASRGRDYWAFRRPVRPHVPCVRDRGWVSTAPDAFVLARLEQAGLRPTPAAGRAALLRRVTFDLTGLPPTPEEVEDFARDPRPDAYVRVVDRLLSSPAYGERWGQHWLDVVRYAESNGYEVDGDRPHAWRYRDWVIRAFNEDMPFDRFLTEQGRNPESAQETPTRWHRSSP